MSPFWCFVLAVYMFSFGIIVGVKVVESHKTPAVSETKVSGMPPVDRIFDSGFNK